MTYQPPIPAILQSMQIAGRLQSDFYHNITLNDARAILDEAGKFAAEQIAPLNRLGDKTGARYANGAVTTVPGWRETYQAWQEAGWNSLTGPAEFGGQQLPMLMAVACAELWNAACVSFALIPLLTTGAIEAISAHASPALKAQYLPKLVSGVWTGTMNLTEPQSGSDLSGIRCKASREVDGSYRITGNKIYITYGEHDCADNIIHLVLARLTDAPPGTRGISLFLVPKILANGERNDLSCSSIEQKLGIHGSPTCTMNYGDKGGAIGWLIGEENRGLACMFTMMNNARLLVATQGVGLAERATQAALAFARARFQGRGPGQSEGQSPIINHPDVKRMLLEMQSKTAAARMLCMATASALDEATLSADPLHRKLASARASLLTPLAKSFSTDIAVEVASVGIQVHGGMGYVEETGAAQYLRDARILPIYEGTNGIQAIDLVTRKLQSDDGEAFWLLLVDCEKMIAKSAELFAETGTTTLVLQSVACVRTCAQLILDSKSALPLAIAGPFQRAVASTVACSYMLDVARATHDSVEAATTLSNAKFFAALEVAAAIAQCEAMFAAASVILDVEF